MRQPTPITEERSNTVDLQRAESVPATKPSSSEAWQRGAQLEI